MTQVAKAWDAASRDNQAEKRPQTAAIMIRTVLFSKAIDKRKATAPNANCRALSSASHPSGVSTTFLEHAESSFSETVTRDTSLRRFLVT